jgi:two-component system sensor histidine kinase DevS
VSDEDGHILFANRQVAQMFGYDQATLLDLRVDDLLPERLRTAHRDHRARYHAQPRVRAMGVGLILHGYRADGSEFPVEISLSPVGPADGQQLVVAAVRDVRERIATEERLRSIGQHLRLVEDRERIARELHDVVIQKLFAAGMTVQALAVRTADATLAERLDTVVDELDETIREIRTAIYGLQAGDRNTPGVRADVLRICDEHRDALGVEPKVRFDGPVESITERVASELLPVVREAVSNVARHANASAVDVWVKNSGDFVTVRVADDGRGLPGDTSGGNGIPNLSDRAVRLGGRCALTTRPEGGTALEWTVPNIG